MTLAKSKWANLVMQFLAAFFIGATLIPVMPFEEWFVRIFDFPRLQIVFLLFLILTVFLIWFRKRNSHKVYILLLVGALIYQVVRILPYTSLSSVMAHAATDVHEESRRVKLLVSNVYMENKDHDYFVQMVQKEEPDLFFALESDTAWQSTFYEHFAKDYPYRVNVPRDNTYGMHVFSKLELLETEVKYWIDRDIPSVQTLILLESGDTIRFYGLHPKPPVPTEDDDSRKRDAEIMIVANRVADAKYPVIVAGDFNDVAWSSTTRLFLKSSGLLDPRIGRGFFNTFNARNWLFRWPLDHFFYSTDFQLVDMQRYPDIKSDHYPIGIQLVYRPGEKTVQKPLQPDDSTKEEETETIKEGLKDARDGDE